MPLYHFQIGFPALEFKPVFGLIPTAHAREEAMRDFRGEIEIPKHFLPRVAKVIEVEMNENGVAKILARQRHDAQHDVVFAFNPRDKRIKTVWLQSRADLHRTLDRARYDKP